MKNVILKITRNSESEFSVYRLLDKNINPDYYTSWDSIRAEMINSGKAIKSGYFHVVAGLDEWVCYSDCIFNLDDSDFLFSIEDESANENYPTAYLLHYEYNREKLREQTKLEVVWCSSNYLIDYTTGYQAYRCNVRKNIIDAINGYERKRKSRASSRHN